MTASINFFFGKISLRRIHDVILIKLF
jgi:hypothetical protein